MPGHTNVKTAQRIRKLCRNVEIYVVRIRGKSQKKYDYTESKPCERCAELLTRLGFRKINYIGSDKKSKKLEKKVWDGKSSWGLRNLRKQTSQVARTINTCKCISHCDSSDDSGSELSDSDSVIST